jgi:response regulator RpfG family c-di-GMP phosphodiesterase
MLAPTVSHNSPFRPVPAPKTRLLLIADSADRLKELKAGISTTDFDITTASNLKELRAVCRNHHDLAVLDVNSVQIKPMLSVLRANVLHASIPVFADSARLQENQGLAGVLPTYRAMACSRAEMQMLVKLFCHGSQQPETGRVAEANRLALL